MGAGKTVVGALVAQRSQSVFRDLDMMIEDHAGMAISDMFAIGSESVFRTIESELLPKALVPGAVVALGGGTTMDDKNWDLIRSRAETVYLDASLDTLWSRISEGGTRPLAAGRSRAQLAGLLDARRSRYAEADHAVDANRALDAVATEVLSLWSG
jgi:shikimate kinase